MADRRLPTAVLAMALVFPAALPAAGDGESEWPGRPPDCWPEARNFHGATDGRYWEKNTSITRVRAERPKPGEYSPNKGYYFVVAADWPRARILIDAEKETLIQVEFANAQALGEVRWVNEKLLFIRVWWGRITGNDMILDVESGTVVYSEQFWDGSMARQQFLERCPKTGCTCIGSDVKR